MPLPLAFLALGGGRRDGRLAPWLCIIAVSLILAVLRAPWPAAYAVVLEVPGFGWFRARGVTSCCPAWASAWPRVRVATTSRVVFGVIMRKLIRRGSFTSVKDLRDKLVNFIDYFNRVFAHPFRWTYTGRPLMAKPAA